jgi:hypothetical protein
MEAEICADRQDHVAQTICVIAAIVILVLKIQDDSYNRSGTYELHQPSMTVII